MQCCTILRAFKKGCLLKMGCYSENNSDNFKDLCWPNYLSVTVLLIKLQLQNADSLFKCPFKFSKDPCSLFQCEGTRGVHQYTPSSNIVQHREHVWCPPWCGPRGGTVEEYFHFLTLPGLGCLARGILGPRPIPHISLRGAGPTIAHMGTLMMHWQRPPHPSHRSCSVQFILMLIHAIDCGVEPGHAAAGVLHMFQSVSGCRVFLPLPSPLCPDPASSELISNFTIFATVLPISLSAPR